MMPSPKPRITLIAAAVVGLSLGVSACGDGANEGDATPNAANGGTALTASASCSEFMEVSESARVAVASRLSREVGAISPGPAWALQLASVCGSSPTKTLADALGRTAPRPVQASTNQASFEPTRTYKGRASGGDGSEFSLTIDVGGLRKAGRLPSDFGQLATTCSPNPQRDAAIPVRLTVTSLNSPGFDQDIRTGLVLSGFDVVDRTSLYLEAAQNFSDGPTCTTAQSLSRLDVRTKFSGVAADETRSHDVLVYLRNYYDPAHPKGRNAELADIQVGLPVTDATLDCFGGPGGQDGFFSLNGGPRSTDDEPELEPCA